MIIWTNKVITLYHGSTSKIEKPIFGFRNSKDDFGQGFYCTQDHELAKEWALKTGVDGFVNEYSIDDSKLKFLDLKSGMFNIMSWIAILLENRTFALSSAIARQGRDYILSNFSLDLKDYDVLIGYRADNSNFAYINDFLNNAISLRQLTLAIEQTNPKEQYVLKSMKAFELLRFKEALPVSVNQCGYEGQLRDLKARHHYFSKVCNEVSVSDLFIKDIILSAMYVDKISRN